jgi:hypothetical protein
MAAYSEATGDWSLVDSNWSFIKGLFGEFTAAYNSAQGFCVFPKWHVGKLGLDSQIGAAAGMVRMATRRGDGSTIAQAQTLLNNLLATRVRLGHYIRDQYDAGKVAPLPLRIDADGVPNHDDIFKYNDPGELLPLDGDRNRTSDVRQVNWSDGNEIHTHSAAGFMHYAALVGYSPLYPELAERLRSELLTETRQYVQTYEANAPWWWMSDLAHHTTAGGEHLWHSPTLAHDIFQTKAWVLREGWEALLHQLPQPMSINPRYDLYRLHNLATLLALSAPDLSSSSLSATPAAPASGARTTLLFRLRNIGGPLEGAASLVVALPPELSYIAGSASASLGTVSVNGASVTWSGISDNPPEVTIRFDARVMTSALKIVTVSGRLTTQVTGALTRDTRVFLNGHSLLAPLIKEGGN